MDKSIEHWGKIFELHGKQKKNMPLCKKLLQIKKKGSCKIR